MLGPVSLWSWLALDLSTLPTRRVGARIAASLPLRCVTSLPPVRPWIREDCVFQEPGSTRSWISLTLPSLDRCTLGCALGAPADLRGAALKELSLAGSHTQQVHSRR